MDRICCFNILIKKKTLLKKSEKINKYDNKILWTENTDMNEQKQ